MIGWKWLKKELSKKTLKQNKVLSRRRKEREKDLSMKSHILFPSGKTITFEIDSCRSIFDLKRHIRDEQGVPLDLLVLKHENVEMTDATPLSLLCSDSNEANLKAFIDLDGGQGISSFPFPLSFPLTR